VRKPGEWGNQGEACGLTTHRGEKNQPVGGKKKLEKEAKAKEKYGGGKSNQSSRETRLSRLKGLRGEVGGKSAQEESGRSGISKESIRNHP